MATKGELTREKILGVSESLILENGYSGTSIDEIILATGLTKGAFFYHFKDKSALARALAQRYWDTDFQRVMGFAERARTLADNPVQAMHLFFKLFEEFMDSLSAVPEGCLFASYVYESRQFAPDINEFVANGFKEWTRYMEGVFADAIATGAANKDISSVHLAELSISIIEGGFILARSNNDPALLARQSRTFRALLENLFTGTPA